jgi:hypothetical protein
MPYILWGLFILILITIAVRKFIDWKEKVMLKKNCDLHSKKLKECSYRGKPFNNEWKELYDDVHNN